MRAGRTLVVGLARAFSHQAEQETLAIKSNCPGFSRTCGVTIPGMRLALRLARPVYECLPAVYAAIGCLALVISYVDAGSTGAVISFGIGVAAVIVALMLALRRQDFRELQRDYSGISVDQPFPPADIFRP